MKTKYEIAEAETSGIFNRRELDITGLSNAMDEYAKEVAIAYLNWVIDTMTTDEGRLPFSNNSTLGGKTFYQNGEERQLSELFNQFTPKQ